MPLVEIHTQPDCQWGIWRIEEAWPELLRGLERREAHRPFLDGIRADGRRTEWLAVRALLKVMMGGREPAVAYRPEGYPYLPDAPDVHVSFTHTRGYAAAICARTPAVGIDVERPMPRILGLRNRFLSPDEEQLIAGPDPDDPLRPTLCWSAKETVFKMLRLRSADWLRDVRLLDFDASAGRLRLREHLTPRADIFTICAAVYPDFVLTRGVGREDSSIDEE
ncbi:hypothetical protein BHU16_05590 [Tannerella sp. oral taxon 808]|nr:hypothetical protein BHU16_05590 [Tannerella sp. oral taxon 808]